MRIVRPLLAMAAVAVLPVLGACTGNPSAKEVAVDVVESIDLTDSQRECMLGKLDDYTPDQISAIGEANRTVNFDAEDAVESATPEFRAFVDDLNACMTG